jgi:transposase-like protein
MADINLAIVKADQDRARDRAHRRHVYSDEFKAEVVAPVLNHEMTCLERSESLGLPQSSVYCWVRKAAPLGWISKAKPRHRPRRSERELAPDEDAAHEDARCPRCARPPVGLTLRQQLARGGQRLVPLEFDTDGLGRLIEYCPDCGYYKKVSAA